MDAELLTWAGFSLSFLAAFVFSLFHVALSSFTKISISRFLEDREKDYRTKILEIYDELKISAEVMRILFLVAFIVYFFIIFPRLRYWPLWTLLCAVAIYIVFFEFLPRLMNAVGSRLILTFFLSSFRIPYFLSMPLLWLIKISAVQKEPEEQREASEEEIQALIDEAKEEGIIEKEEGVLLKSVVEFGDTIVREIMTPRVSMICIPKNKTIHNLRELVIKEKHSRIPVYKDRIDNIEGIVIAKDLLEYSADRHLKDSLESLIRPVYFIPESMKVPELLKEFQVRKQKLAIVVDEHGGVSGLVTMEDLMEEIVGEIQDEYDKDEVQIIQQGPEDYIVLGDAEVGELEDLFDLDLAEDDYLTIGGMITHHLGKLPEQGEIAEVKGLEFEVLDVGQKRIKKLRISRAEKKKE